MKNTLVPLFVLCFSKIRNIPAHFRVQPFLLEDITETKNSVGWLTFGILQGFDRIKSPVTKTMSINEKNALGHN